MGFYFLQWSSYCWNWRTRSGYIRTGLCQSWPISRPVCSNWSTLNLEERLPKDPSEEGDFRLQVSSLPCRGSLPQCALLCVFLHPSESLSSLADSVGSCLLNLRFFLPFNSLAGKENKPAQDPISLCWHYFVWSSAWDSSAPTFRVLGWQLCLS